MDLMAGDWLRLSNAPIGSASHGEEETIEQYWKKNPTPQESEGGSGDSEKRCREGEIKERMAALRRWEEESRGGSMGSWLSLSSSSDDGRRDDGTKKRQRQSCDDGWLSLSRDSSSVSKGSTSDLGSSNNPFKKMREVAPGPVGDSRRCMKEGEDAGHKEGTEAESSTAANVEAVSRTSSQHAYDGLLLLLRKTVTQSDTSREQHRLQLTQSDIDGSQPPLRELASLAFDRRIAGVDVQVSDRKGNMHELKFKYVDSSRTYRFMGKGYTQFLIESQLTAGQTMLILGLPRATGNGEHRLAFINSDIVLS